MVQPCFVIVNSNVRQSVLPCGKRIRFDKKHMARGSAGTLSSALSIILACPDQAVAWTSVFAEK
jgi:hypothetical protein